MMGKSRGTTDIFKEIVEIPGLEAAIVVGRDGFVIESAGNVPGMELDALGGCLATAISGIENMGKELKIKAFQDLFIEYGGATILCRPTGDTVIAMVAPDASQLGSIRYRIKTHLAELKSFF